MVLLASVKEVSLGVYNLLLFYFMTLHLFKPVDLSIESFLPKVGILVHVVLLLLQSNLGIRDGEVLVESLLFRDKVRRQGIRVVHFGTVHEFVVTACPLTQTSLLNPLLVLHCSLSQSYMVSYSDYGFAVRGQ